MRILSIDPSSAKAEESTSGIVLLNNAQLENYWIIPAGFRNIDSWYEENRSRLNFDVVVIEEFEARDNDKSKDNTVLQTIAHFQNYFPEAILQRNAGYQSDIPDALLKKLGLWKFDKSHHNDVRAAARLGLFWAMRNDIEEVIHDIGKVVIGDNN